ncbi:hypothetical protein B7Z28_02265, partial [Candidatus Saccharibacteria bacterium 32-45-3]
MVLLDKRFSLAFYHDKKRTVQTLLFGFLVFVLWDIFGIAFGIFFSPDSAYTTGWYLAPDFPIEEVFFL